MLKPIEGITLEVDQENGLAYLYLDRPGNKVGVTQVINDYMNLDYDDDGRLIGIEFMNLDMMPKAWTE